MKVRIDFWIALFLPLVGVSQGTQLVSQNHIADTSVSGQGTVSLLQRRILPLFGELPKTSTQIDEEIHFLSSCDREFTSRDEASQFFSKMAWEYLQEGQLDTASYRFNLAFLLNDKNVEPYWGLGVICYQKDQVSEALRMLNKGVDLAPDNVALLVDLSTVELKSYGADSTQTEILEDAHKRLIQAKEADSTYAQTYYNLALADFYKEQYEESWKNLHEGRQLNFSLVNFDFIDLLKAKLPDPQGFFK